MSKEFQLTASLCSEGKTATTDYFIEPYLKSLGYQIRLLDKPSLDKLDSYLDCDVCVISRYISYSHLNFLQELKLRGVKIIYFMDDDLFDINALSGLPYKYQWKIFTQAFIYQSKLKKICDEFWVSTAYLAEKYADLNPMLLNPIPSVKTAIKNKTVSVCYHGTASHNQEIRWLIEIIEAVQSSSENIYFELFGTKTINKLFANYPRVSILHPMKWSNYFQFTASQKRDIALAPLLENDFNAARGATKFYDYARLGAVGIYSNVVPYKGFIRDGVDGILLENKVDTWVDNILALSQNQHQRNILSQAIEQRVFDMVNSLGG